MKKKPQPTSLENLKAEEALLEQASNLTPEEFASRAEALMSQYEQPEGRSYFQQLGPVAQQAAIRGAKEHGISVEDAAEFLVESGMT